MEDLIKSLTNLHMVEKMLILIRHGQRRLEKEPKQELQKKKAPWLSPVILEKD